MQNLVLLGDQRRRLDLNVDNESSDRYVADLCHVGVSNDGMYSDIATVALTNDGYVSRLSSSSEAESDDHSTPWTCNLNEIHESSAWFNISYTDPDIVCLSKNGAIVTVSPSTGEPELVGVFDHGLEAACWSPDGEVLLMVTSVEDDDSDSEKKKSVLMTMNSQFEVLMEITIPDYVSSLLGTAAAPDQEVNTGISVVWRPDGSLCAMSAVDAEDNTRKVRIYKRESLELVAIGRSEDASGTLVKNLQDTGLAWAGTGCSQVLAAVQRKGKRTLQVVFFEPNGLRHREFILREAPTTNVLDLSFNVSSQILAVHLRQEDGTDKVQLWHRSNYHWYLKKEFRFADEKVIKVKFDEEKATNLVILLANLVWRECVVQWDPSTTFSLDDDCTAFVVDGNKLNMTPLNRALVPPPMSLSSVEVDLPISEMTFCFAAPHQGCMLLLLSDGSLTVLSKDNTVDGDNWRIRRVVWENLVGLPPTTIRSILVVGANDDELIVVGVAESESLSPAGEHLLHFVISGLDSKEPKANIVDTKKLDSRILRMVQWSDSGDGALVELDNGVLLELQKTGELVPSSEEVLLEPCPWLCGIKDISRYDDSNQLADSSSSTARLVFGLSPKSRLYFRDIMLADSASSMFLALSHGFLCYATAGSRCHLRFIPLVEIQRFDPLMGMDHGGLVLEGYEPRPVERGAKLVAVFPQQPMLVLQLPRGNLEGLHPRALVVRYVMTKITQRNYGDAFQVMRKHKVDLNLLVDLAPSTFVKHGIDDFVSQVQSIDHLNLFISGLKDYDITASRFPVPSWIEKEHPKDEASKAFDFSNKVNHTCRCLRSHMMKQQENMISNTSHYLLPILSTYAKENPPALDDALRLIKTTTIQNEKPTSKKNILFAESAQKAIQYLAFLAEYPLLFDTSLSMYDYDMARAVARNSQMDPKMYLPLLKRLVSLPSWYARFEVDIRLARFEHAVENLFHSHKAEESIDEFRPSGKGSGDFGNDFEHCLNLVEKHSLHRIGLRLFANDSAKTRTLLVSLGESLLTSHPEVSLGVFMRAEPPFLDGAIRAARQARDWRSYFDLKKKIDGEEKSPFYLEQRRQTARDIVDEIIAAATFDISKSKKEIHSDAARILLDYGDDVVGAIDILLTAQHWSESHRLASLHSRADLVSKCSDAVVEYAHSIFTEFTERASIFTSTNERYAEVLKLRKRNVFETGPVEADFNDTDSLFSVASNLSNTSARSSFSSSSTGSTVSTSSVISIKSATTFSMTGGDEENRHRSKFNQGKKKKKTKKKRAKGRRKPGSIEELNDLVGTLKMNCPDRAYSANVSDTIKFLIFLQRHDLASEMYSAYNTMQEAIAVSQSERKESTEMEKSQFRDQIRTETEVDNSYLTLELPIEQQIDGLLCFSLPAYHETYFEYIM